MRHIRYHYAAEAAVEMSLAEIGLLYGLAKDHPHFWCSSLAKEGGLLYDLKRLLEDSPRALILLSCKNLSVLCEILETPGSESALKEELRQTMTALYKSTAKEGERANLDRR